MSIFLVLIWYQISTKKAQKKRWKALFLAAKRST